MIAYQGLRWFSKYEILVLITSVNSEYSGQTAHILPEPLLPAYAKRKQMRVVKLRPLAPLYSCACKFQK